MSTQINGNGTVPEATNPAHVAIVSSTNATPIVVTTGTHGYATGDTVEIDGHATNTNANGLWSITVLSSTTFSLVGSVGNGVGGATGYCVDYSVNPLIQIPADLTDSLDAASVSPAFSGLFNLAPYLYRRVGAFRLHEISTFGSASNAVNPSVWSTTTPSANTWTACTSMSDLLSQIPICDDTSQLEVDLSFAANLGGTLGTFAAFAIGMNDNGGAYTVLPGSSRSVTQGSSACQISLKAISAVGANHKANFALMCRADNGTTNFALFTAWTIVCKHYRSNA